MPGGLFHAIICFDEYERLTGVLADVDVDNVHDEFHVFWSLRSPMM